MISLIISSFPLFYVAVLQIFSGRGLWRGRSRNLLYPTLAISGVVTGFAWAYVRFGSLPQVSGILYGVKPVIIAIVLQALWCPGLILMSQELSYHHAIEGLLRLWATTEAENWQNILSFLPR